MTDPTFPAEQEAAVAREIERREELQAAKLGAGESNLTLADGRVLTVRKLAPSGLLKIYEACGGFVPSAAWVRLAQYTSSVVAIDGVPLPFPRDKTEIETRADRIGEEGLATVMQFFDAEAGAGTDAAKN